MKDFLGNYIKPTYNEIKTKERNGTNAVFQIRFSARENCRFRDKQIGRERVKYMSVTITRERTHTLAFHINCSKNEWK